jgi:sugar/nucleoside kinase (ribokinase family)
MAPAAPQLVVVGAAARDLDASDPRGWRLGGGVSYGALLAARLGARVGAVVGLDREARDAHELELLRGAGVELEVVPLEAGPVFENIETPFGRRQICQGISDPIDPSSFPGRWREGAAYLLAPVAGELTDAWVDLPPPDALVALAWQGLLRQLEPGQPVVHLPAEPRPLFARADLGGVSREDLRAGGAALAELLPRPGQELAITAGERGALHLRRLASGFDVRRVPAVPARQIGDLVGAGDSFLTTLVVARLPTGPFGPRPLALGRALHLAALVATLGIERVGLAGRPDTSVLRQWLAEMYPRREASVGPRPGPASRS